MADGLVFQAERLEVWGPRPDSETAGDEMVVDVQEAGGDENVS